MQPFNQNPETGPVKSEAGARLLKIFLDESCTYKGRPTYEVLLEMLNKENCAGATVSRAFSGFGGNRLIHTDRLVDMLPQLPLIIEVVDSAEQLARIRPKLEEIIEEGLIIVQDVEIWKYSYHSKLREVPSRVAVSEVMTKAAVSVNPQTPLVEVVRLLLDQDYFKALPVIDANRIVVGIITDGDLLNRGDVPHRLGVLETLDRENLHRLMEDLHHSPKKAEDVMTAPAVTVRLESSVREAAKMMVARNLKRMPVVDAEGRLVGMLGRLDVLKLVATNPPARQRGSGWNRFGTGTGEQGNHPVYRVAQDVMVSEVPTALPNTPVSDLLDRLLRSQLRRLVVVDEEKRILGVVTDADLVARVSANHKPGILAALGQSLGLRHTPSLNENQGEVTRRSARTAGELMSRKVVTVGPEVSLDEVVKLMVAHRVKFLPVVDAQGKVLGVVLRRDVLRAVAESLE